MSATTQSKKKVYTAKHVIPDMADVLDRYGDRVAGISDACEQVPMIGQVDFDNLVDSIQSNGIIDPIRLDTRRLLLDGRSRLMALYVLQQSLGDSDCVVTEDHSPETIAETNFSRRHLTLDQRLAFALDKVNKATAEARERRRAGGDQGRKNRKAKSLGAESAPSQPASKTRRIRPIDQVAKSEGLPRDLLRKAKRVGDSNPELIKEVQNGKLSLAKAEAQVGLGKTSKKKVVVKRKVRRKARQPMTIFGDRSIEILQYDQNIRITNFERVMVCSHDVQLVRYVAYRNQRVWRVGQTDSSDWIEVSNEADAQKLLLRQMRAHLKQAEESSGG